ncbi:Spy/CpxP family protein refolding chaperone [Methylobacillus arboreus]|uniref:Spy/CpxP family protein refolding chaperone n=1 Tax=Methylobacillus arboreus TaxID=755170 RepID=UPI001E3173C5|nr:Spy/CpxP family protein refolding chaperone [Methylobacillus arboreus]MCB5189540.1 Spy/CpxP family protein refolding chaperone [Methylobacillus arboreus]
MKTASTYFYSSIITGAVIGLVSLFAQAEPLLAGDAPFRPAPGFFHEGPSLPPHIARLDLNEAQEDKIFQLLHAEAPAVRDNFKQQRKLREEIDTLAKAPTLDEKKARQLATELGRLQADAIFSRVNTEARIRTLLTQEQRAKLENRQHSGKGRPEHLPQPGDKPRGTPPTH